jgi:hypothetical protein
MANRNYDAQYEPRPGEQSAEEKQRHHLFLDALARAPSARRSRSSRTWSGASPRARRAT